MQTQRPFSGRGLLRVGPLAWFVFVIVVVQIAVVVVSADQADQAGQAQRETDWFAPEADTQELRRALGDEQVSGRWIYHDLDAARDQARQSGKPIMVVFRCVPCGSAPGLDGAICTAGGADASKFEEEIQAAGGQIDALLDQFVTVRMVKMNGANRNLFAFDRDVPYAVMFINAEGQVYGRYGTRVSQDRKNLARHNLPSLQHALQRALDLHTGYPGNSAVLAGKMPEPREPAFIEQIEEFKPFPPQHNRNVPNCIHCHTAGEAELREKIADGFLTLRDILPYPLPNSLGMVVDVEDGLKIESVDAGSAAARAGLRAGDVLEQLGGQALTSEADIQWVLHHAEDQGALPVVFRRGERVVQAELALEGDWRKTDGSWRATLGVLRPSVKFVSHARGLQAKWPHDKAAEAGLRRDDIVVAVDGRNLKLEADFLRYIYSEQPDLQTVELTVLRGGNRTAITLPVR